VRTEPQQPRHELRPARDPGPARLEDAAVLVLPEGTPLTRTGLHPAGRVLQATECTRRIHCRSLRGPPRRVIGSGAERGCVDPRKRRGAAGAAPRPCLGQGTYATPPAGLNAGAGAVAGSTSRRAARCSTLQARITNPTPASRSAMPTTMPNSAIFWAVY